MAVCSSCGESLGAIRDDELGRCLACANANKPVTRRPAAHSSAMNSIDRIKAERGQAQVIRNEIDAIVLTTETAPNLPITKRIEIVTAECAFGMNMFKDLFAGVRNIVGGRSEAVQKTMRDSRRTALYELKKEAHAVGANAVVGVDLDYVELAGTGSTMVAQNRL